MLRVLRQPRYLALAAGMLVVAALCVLAGTWQIHRLIQKHDANHELRANARRPAVAVNEVLASTSAPDPARGGYRVQYRRVTATGVYDATAQLLVRAQSVGATVGYLVLTPLRPASGPPLLVVRGFLAADGDRIPQVAQPPSGTVTVTGRVEPSDRADDRFGREPAGQIRTVNANQAAARLREPVYDGYVELLAGSPGDQGLTVIPDPDLSNPAGGAVEPQHLAYVAQWYLFALLALGAPLVMARAEWRRGPDAVAPDPAGWEEPLAPAPTPVERARAAKLAARYGASRR